MKKAIFALLMMFSIVYVLKKHTNKQEYPKEQMIINYYSKTYSLDKYDSHEMVLSTTSDSSKMRLDIYKKLDNNAETKTTVYLPNTVIDDCMKWIKECKMNTWNQDSQGISLDGKLMVCKFYFNGEYIRVSTDCMPENGEQMIEEVANIISKHVSQKYEH